MKTLSKILSTAALLAALCFSASASTITGGYTNESTFTGASGPVTTITFEGLVSYFSTSFPGNQCLPNVDFTNCSVNVEGFIGTSNLPNVLYLTEGDNNSLYQWGNGDIAGISLGQGAANDGHTVICLSADPACVNAGTASSSAFSFELMTIMPTAATVDVLVRTADGTARDFSVATGEQPTRTFFGVTTDGDIITSVTLRTGGSGDAYVLFDNLQYQLSPNADQAPEPASLVLLGSGMLAAVSSLRFRRRHKQS